MPHTPLTMPPSAILLATDLSARCDRALSRALQLARQWNARLVVATVLPPAQARAIHVFDAGDEPDQAHHVAERRLHRELGPEAEGVSVEVRVAEGHVGRALLQLALDEGCGLIVTGVASDPVFELPSLGSTVVRLTRHSTLPVLVVHRRTHHPYRNLAIATDFSDSARHAAEQALALFGTPLRLTLAHALESPDGALLDRDRTQLQEQARSLAHEQARTFQSGLPLPADQVRTLIEPGDPARLLRHLAEAEDIDLAVVATHGRSALFDLLIGSIARQLVATLETDTLLVRDHRARPPAQG